MNSASRKNVPAYEWQGRCSSFLTVNVAVTQCFHLCSWLSYQIFFLVPECFPYELCCVLSLCEWTYSEKHSHCLVLRLPTHSCIFLHFFFYFLMPGPELSRDINHRIIERFPHKTGKKKKIKRVGPAWPYIWNQENPEARKSWRIYLSQGTKIVADFI